MYYAKPDLGYIVHDNAASKQHNTYVGTAIIDSERDLRAKTETTTQN